MMGSKYTYEQIGNYTVCLLWFYNVGQVTNPAVNLFSVCLHKQGRVRR